MIKFERENQLQLFSMNKIIFLGNFWVLSEENGRKRGKTREKENIKEKRNKLRWEREERRELKREKSKNWEFKTPQFPFIELRNQRKIRVSLNPPKILSNLH